MEVYEYPKDQCKEELADELIYHFKYEGTEVLNSTEQMFDAMSNTFRLQFSSEGTERRGKGRERRRQREGEGRGRGGG